MDKDFSTKIKELRESLNLTQSEFSNLINVTQAALSTYEKGTRKPTLETLLCISEKLDVSLDWLCGISNKKFIGYETYNDIFIELLNLCRLKYPNTSSTKHEHVLQINLKYEDSDKISFDIYDQNIKNFFSSWTKIYKNYSDGLIDDEIYTLWLEREMKKYTFKITGLPECFS